HPRILCRDSHPRLSTGYSPVVVGREDALMKCEWIREIIVLHVYGEIADDARHELEQHVARCADCAAELKAEQNFHATLSQIPAAEPTPNLLTASPMRLQEALETAEQGHFWHKLAFDPMNWLRQVKFSPALASVILIVGFAGGVGATIKIVKTPGPVADHQQQDVQSPP